jgi:hypothetical protein
MVENKIGNRKDLAHINTKETSVVEESPGRLSNFYTDADNPALDADSMAKGLITKSKLSPLTTEDACN